LKEIIILINSKIGGQILWSKKFC